MTEIAGCIVSNSSTERCRQPRDSIKYALTITLPFLNMTEMNISTPERRLQTHKMVQDLLKERQQMWTLYWEVAELKPFDKHDLPIDEILRKFCQILIDYISLGHFGIYQRIINGTERRKKVLDAAQRLYPDIAQATEVALKFNDKYENANFKDMNELTQELSNLGEALATRIELEDRLIDSMSK